MARWQEWHRLHWRPVSTKAAPWRGHSCTWTLLTKILKLLFWYTFKIRSTPLTVLNEGTISSSKGVVLQLECFRIARRAGSWLHPQSFWSLNLGWGPGLVSKSSQVTLMLLVRATLRITMLRNLFLERVNLLKLSLVIKVWIKLGNSMIGKNSGQV